MKTLQPAEVWKYFYEILKIPRLSKNEQQIIAYLENFAAQYSLEFRQDEVGNCLITKAASKGFEDREIIVLQSHIDMVGEKLLDVEHDFSRDPIKAIVKDGWVTADGTTLGADDGIGVAATMAILASDSIKHGPLECLFTVDEETGMSGAFGLATNFIKGKILLNLDSEDEGEIFIGCAGGIDTIGSFKKEFLRPGKDSVALEFVIEGLQGGHSGDEIHKGFANAIKIMNRLLWNLDQHFEMHISSFEGGKLRNAIPREANAKIVVKKAELEEINMFFASFITDVSKEIMSVEPGFKMSLQQIDIPEKCLTVDFQRRLMNVIYACPHGVISWSNDIPGLVETSTNMAVLKNTDADSIELLTSQRSSVASAKQDIANRIGALFTLGGANVRHSSGYPGWKPDKNSKILSISLTVYKKLFKKAPEVKAIHAGLECGLFLQKYPELDMISFGPTIKGAHTPEERLEIKSLSRFWDFLLELLKNAPRKE